MDEVPSAVSALKEQVRLLEAQIQERDRFIRDVVERIGQLDELAADMVAVLKVFAKVLALEHNFGPMDEFRMRLIAIRAGSPPPDDAA